MVARDTWKRSMIWASGFPFVNGAKYLLSQILWVGSHTCIVSPSSHFQQIVCVHKLPLQRRAKRLNHINSSFLDREVDTRNAETIPAHPER